MISWKYSREFSNQRQELAKRAAFKLLLSHQIRARPQIITKRTLLVLWPQTKRVCLWGLLPHLHHHHHHRGHQEPLRGLHHREVKGPGSFRDLICGAFPQPWVCAAAHIPTDRRTDAAVSWFWPGSVSQAGVQSGLTMLFCRSSNIVARWSSQTHLNKQNRHRGLGPGQVLVSMVD